MAGPGRTQISSGDYIFVIAVVGRQSTRMEELADFGQFCCLVGYGQGGTGFAHLGR